MDTLTHALSGALAARATAPRDRPPRSIPRRVAAGFFACAAPDLDVIVAWFGPVEYLLNHRGVTHSILMIPLWALPLSWLLAKILREPRGWRALYGVCALSLAMHIAGDLITSFGTIVFAPFSDWRAGIGTTFIIDLWFTGIVLAGLFASAVFYRSKLPSIAALALLCAYVGFQFAQRQEALDFGRDYARVLGMADASVTAHPRPVSPFNWTVYVSDETTHRFAHINLARSNPKSYRAGDGFVAKLDAAYRPLLLADWTERARYDRNPAMGFAREAWNSPALDFLRWFMELPALDGVTERPDCAWFVDLRLATPGRDYVPFQFGACRDSPRAPWQAYERTQPGTPLRRLPGRLRRGAS